MFELFDPGTWCVIAAFAGIVLAAGILGGGSRKPMMSKETGHKIGWTIFAGLLLANILIWK